MAKPQTLRCAIYTRKSSEEGLDQAFNSLHAQREACEAYIKSQHHEGWRLIKTLYDDGGFSGGSMERPALKSLLGDIDNGLIDVVLVYKVDRLTRSLTDFARIVECFDSHVVSFVSVTQSFNTTSSMGRLTLNVLLSFAQFEREVTGERIRDKIAASKAKGMWMGGRPPLGYDVRDRKLVLNEEEAAKVRLIFQRYLDVGSVTSLAQTLKLDGIHGKRWVTQKGKTCGGSVLSRGALYGLLRNRIYLGEIVHKGEVYPGEHGALLDHDLWDQVQTMLESHRRRYASGVRENACLLTGLLFDDNGNPMSPTHAVKKDGTRYRYYVSQALLTGNKSEAGSLPRISASAIEGLVVRQLAEHLPPSPNKSELQKVGRSLVCSEVTRIDIAKDRVMIHLADQVIRVPVCLKTRGGATLLVTPQGTHQNQVLRVDPKLVRALARAWRWRRALEQGNAHSIMELANQAGHTERYITRLLRLAYLAPDIIDAILEGSQPFDLTLGKLRATEIPLDWHHQRQVFGVTTSP